MKGLRHWVCVFLTRKTKCCLPEGQSIWCLFESQFVSRMWSTWNHFKSPMSDEFHRQMAEVFIATRISRMTVSTVGIVAYDEYFPQHLRRNFWSRSWRNEAPCQSRSWFTAIFIFDYIILLQQRDYQVFSTSFFNQFVVEVVFFSFFPSPDFIIRIVDTTSFSASWRHHWIGMKSPRPCLHYFFWCFWSRSQDGKQIHQKQWMNRMKFFFLPTCNFTSVCLFFRRCLFLLISVAETRQKFWFIGNFVWVLKPWSCFLCGRSHQRHKREKRDPPDRSYWWLNSFGDVVAKHIQGPMFHFHYGRKGNILSQDWLP